MQTIKSMCMGSCEVMKYHLPKLVHGCTDRKAHKAATALDVGITPFTSFTLALSRHCRMSPSTNAFHCLLSSAFLFQLAPSFFFSMASFNLLFGCPHDLFPLLHCDSVQHLVQLFSFILAIIIYGPLSFSF